MATRSRRDDGQIRPTVARSRQKRAALRTEEDRARRREWLAQFVPGARTRFFRMADTRQAVWLKAASEKLGVPQEDAAVVLERIAEEKRWMKLRLADGMVVGIAPPKNGKRLR
jgi:hypothetical protein